MREPDPGLEELLEERIVIMQELRRALLPQARVLERLGVCARYVRWGRTLQVAGCSTSP